MSPPTLWRSALAMVAVSAFIVTRACAFEFGTVAGYLGYLFFYVLLPGTVTLYIVNRGRVSLLQVLALGIPTGFAVEIFTYLGLSALNGKFAYSWTPIGWIALVVAIRFALREWPVRVRVSAHHAGLCLGLCAAFLGTALMAASQMFSESPLSDGLPTRAIFHDWVYLVSRAAMIKNNWPLNDPSLSGTPLQYHYFMMVHAAAASWTTGVELTEVMLRLLYVPLGAALVAQSYVLGRAVSRSPWGGVAASVLTVCVSEMSLTPKYGETMFLGLFVRWLFVSPTFFFGLIFCGALLIAIGRCARLARCDARHYIWLLLLGTAGTGAKGTVLPVILLALGLWTAWRWLRERRLPARPVIFGVCLTVAFLVVYIPTMSSWRTGDAAWRPFHVFQLTEFWKQNLQAWQHGFARWLPASVATPCATICCAAVVFAGTCGVRMLSVAYLLWGDRQRRDSLLAGWLGAFLVASAGMGMLLELNSYGELYVILMIRLPMSVLTAGGMVWIARRLGRWWRERPVVSSARPWAGPALYWFRRGVLGAGVAFCVSAFAVQSSLWWARNSSGLREWLRTPTDLKPDDYMQHLQEALLWVRSNTEPNAVLVANAFTPENMKKDHWGALDRTLMGVHFYYSALSERRLWFEGPNYIMDTTRARLRASLASNFFYRRGALPSATVSSDPSYVLLDHSLADGARVELPLESRVFSNCRFDIYRLSAPAHDGTTFALARLSDGL